MICFKSRLWMAGFILCFFSYATPAFAYRLAHVSAEQADLKTSANSAAPVEGELAKGTVVNTTDQPKNGYYLVSSSNSSGWVRAEDLKFASEYDSSRSPASTGHIAGAIVSTSGDVFVTPGGLGQKTRLRSGNPLYVHDFIDTAANGSAKILLKDHTVLDLGPSTHFMVDQYFDNQGPDRQVELQMTSGTIRGAVVQKITGGGSFHLKTKSATMGVRGTEFVAQSSGSDGATKITCIQGEVSVGGASGAVTLAAGQQSIASVTGVTNPVALGKAAIFQMGRSTTVMDNTFIKTVTLNTSSASSSIANKTEKSNKTREPSSAASSSSSDNGDNNPKGTLNEIGSSIAALNTSNIVNSSSTGIAGTVNLNNPQGPAKGPGKVSTILVRWN